jgi:hypothetical protein
MNQQHQEYLEAILMRWPEKQREGATTIIKKYGMPHEATASRLIWFNNGPWKRTILHRDASPHVFPTPHMDFLEQTIDYRTPVELFDVLAHYDGSVYPDRTKGEVSSVCDKEEANILSLNLYHEIVTGKRTVSEAKEFYAQTMANFLHQNTMTPYLKEFLFPQQYYTADPGIRYF